MLKASAQAGDTLIEVLLAITIFSMVSVGAMTIMNQGTNAAQRALEISLVRQQVDAQAESLRAAQQAHAATGSPASSSWNQVIGPDTAHFNDNDCPDTPNGTPMNGNFIMDARDATRETAAEWLKPINTADAPPHAQVRYAGGQATSYGIWIERDEATSGDANTPPAYNFTVRACWYGAGMNTPMRLETVVRLYDPS